MNSYRRLTLQLTPLLDLLLIVIFGQYLHVMHDRVSDSESARAAVSRVAELEQQLILVTNLSRQAEQRALASEGVVIQLQADLDRLLAQQRVAGELMVQLFQLPREQVQRVLDPNRSPANPTSAEDLERLKKQFQDFAQKSPGEMIEHLLSYDEIRKRCDLWEMYVDSSDILTIQLGREVVKARVPLDLDGNVDAAALENDLYARYKGLPQPKTLVIMLLTYDRGTRISVTQPLRTMLPRLLARMQADSIGRSRFEYADLGFKIR